MFITYTLLKCSVPGSMHHCFSVGDIVEMLFCVALGMHV